MNLVPGMAFRTPLFCLCLLLSAVAFAQEPGPATARQLLERMSNAMRELNYDGVFIYHHGPDTETMRIIHKADTGGERERLISLSGPAREVIRDGDSVTCVFSDSQSVIVEDRQFSQELAYPPPESLDALSDLYILAVSDTDRVAGRPAWVVSVSPRDEFRYGYRYWVDQETHLLLQSELRDNKGNMMEQIIFTQLHTGGSIPDTLLEPAISGHNYTWHRGPSDNTRTANAASRWRVTWMPAGFNLWENRQYTSSSSRQKIEHLVYTDGLTTISIFIEKSPSQMAGVTGISRRAGINTSVRYADGYQFMVLGEVPSITTERIAAAISTQK